VVTSASRDRRLVIARVALAGAVAGALMLSACSGEDSGGTGEVPVVAPPGSASGSGEGAAGDPGDSPSVTAPPAGKTPGLRVQVVTDELEHGWDVGFLPDGQVLVTERPARLTLLSSTRPGATVTRVEADLSDVYVEGEGGLLGMVLHPDFAQSRLFTTCQDHQEGGVPVDIRLVTWRLSEDGRSAERVRDLLTGLPVAVGGRHSGCRPTIGPDGALLVGTGDTAVGSIPQDLTSLGGKVLRLDLETGRPLPDNPFAEAADPRQRYVYSYGHRNVQGVAVRPGTGQIYSAEHGPDNNDEINNIEPGQNYGWDPSQGGTVGGYDESVPMTDRQRFPDALVAVWQSGRTTQAICGDVFLEGEQWGGLDGALVVTALKGAKLLILRLDAAGGVTEVDVPRETNGPFGRLRAARLGPDGALYVTTSNGERDRLLRITPA
jgi:aldose sugar dehydrogenase